MPAVTQDDVGNMVLDILTEGAIDSLDEDVKPARLLSRHFDVTVEGELRKHPWTFAIVSAELVGTDLGTPDGTLNWQYELPADAIRVLSPNYDDTWPALPINYRQEGGYLYTDQSSPRTIRYIANVNDPAEWDALFTDVVVAALAVKIAHPLTGKANMVQVATAAYDRAMTAAQRANAIESPGRMYRESWLAERGDNRHWRP